MGNVFRGTSNNLLQRQTEDYSQTNGYIREFEFRGFSEAKARQLAAANAFVGVDYTLSNQQGIWTLVLRDSSGNYTIDTWEIGIGQVLTNSFRNPLNRNKLMFLNTADRSAFLAGVQNKTAWATVYASLVYADKATYQAELIRAYDRFLEGDDSFFADQYAVRHTTNVSNRYLYNIADSRKNWIYSPAKFYSEVQNASLWLFPMPQAFVNVLTSNTAPVIPGALASYYIWGYLKGGSPRTTAANNRTNIVTEYRQYAWSLDEYEYYP